MPNFGHVFTFSPNIAERERERETERDRERKREREMSRRKLIITSLF